MATNRGGSRGGNRRSGRNNNPDGRNQYSGALGTVRQRPLATVAAIGGAVAAGVFLWSRRNQISEQIGGLTDQINDWRDGMNAEATVASGDTTSNAGSAENSATDEGSGTRSQVEIAQEALTLKQLGETA